MTTCSESGYVKNLQVAEPFSTNDHQTIKFMLLLGKNKTLKEQTTYNYFKADYNLIGACAKAKGWEHMSESISTEDFWKKLRGDLLELRDQFVPKHRPKIGKCKWVTKAVARCRLAKKKAWNDYVKSGKNTNLYYKYLQKLQDCVKVNKKAKVDFEVKLAKNIKVYSKSFHAYIGSKQRSKDKAGPLKDDDGTIVNDDQCMAKLFNNYFVSVFCEENLNNIPKPSMIFNGDPSLHGLDKIQVEEHDVFKKLAEINVNKCPGPDGVHPKLLFELKSELVTPLTNLFNTSL